MSRLIACDALHWTIFHFLHSCHFQVGIQAFGSPAKSTRCVIFFPWILCVFGTWLPVRPRFISRQLLRSCEPDIYGVSALLSNGKRWIRYSTSSWKDYFMVVIMRFESLFHSVARGTPASSPPSCVIISSRIILKLMSLIQILSTFKTTLWSMFALLDVWCGVLNSLWYSCAKFANICLYRHRCRSISNLFSAL